MPLFLFAVGCTSSAAPVVEETGNPTTTEVTKKSEETERKTDQHSSDDGHDHDAEKKAERISLADAKKSFDAGEAVFVDTRGKAFFENEHVKGAINVPSGDFESDVQGCSERQEDNHLLFLTG